ncbi:MAG: carboxypeptidase-like regulatory domain-containing protein [Candidatus Sulfotelmatobacter sp.]
MRRADRSSVPSGPWRICIGFFGILLATGCVCLAQTYPQSLQPDEYPRTIRGTVVNAVTGAPIARALVTTLGDRYAMLSDSEGHFEFALPKGRRENGGGEAEFSPSALSARKPGFLDDPSGRNQAEGTAGTDVTIPLLPEGLIHGRVMSSEADPTPGIIVQLLSRQVQDGMLRWVQLGTARANSNGEFRFAELLPGTYRLGTNELMDHDPVITVPGGQQFGFPPVYYPGTSDFAAAGTIQLTAGQTVQADIPVTRQPYYPVKIPVANPGQNSNVNISVSVQGHRGPGYALGYNGNEGRIEGLLPNGKYLVEALGQNSASGALPLTVAGGPAVGASLTLTPNSLISIRVVEEFTSTEAKPSGTLGNGKRTSSAPTARLDLNVIVEPADDFAEQRGVSLRPAKVPDDDSLVLENLSPGRYWLRPLASRGYVASATMGGADLLREPFVVTPGLSTSIEVILRDDTAELDGTVAGITPPGLTVPTASTGISIPQSFVYCIPLPDSPGEFQPIWVSSDGKFNSGPMAPGTYRVLAFKKQQPNIPYRDVEAMKAYETKGQIVHLSAGQKADVQLEMISSSE